LWSYTGNARDYITAMKYRPSVWLCRNAGQLLADYLVPLFVNCRWDMIVPIPSSINSLQDRGFNQCLIMARPVAKAAHASISALTLRHAGCRAAQASLHTAKRIANVRRSFAAAQTAKGKRILLLDDVITTGATSTSAGLALIKAGARSVDLLALARASTWEQHRQIIYRKMIRPCFTCPSSEVWSQDDK
jgi:predicted amidophosphoribosyltransferase